MTFSIACVVFFAAVAIWMTWVAREHQGAAQIHKKTTEDVRATYLRGIESRDRQLAVIAAMLPLHHAAARRGDARQCNAILAGAIAQMNAIATEAIATEADAENAKAEAEAKAKAARS